MICTFCDEDIEAADRGKLQGWERRDMHDECLVRSIAGSAAHQLGECTCFGGRRGDPPDLTRRESARLAYHTFFMLRGEIDPNEVIA